MSAKSIRLRPISRAQAKACVEAWHYSGKAYPKSQVHFGVYWGASLRGALTFGDPLDRRRVLGLVRDTPWEGMAELNRMALAPELPPNSESRALSVAVRLLKKHAPQLQWLLTFADATRCGDGTIYRAHGWWLTGIKPNASLWRFPDGRIWSDVGIRTSERLRLMVMRMGEGVTRSDAGKSSTWRRLGAEPLAGHQLRYIYPLQDDVRDRMTVPILPYDKIQEAGAGMYLGEPR